MKKPVIGIIGLGKMGGNLAKQALNKGYKIIAFDKLPQKGLQNKGVQYQKSLAAMVQKLSAPRIIFLYVPAGEAVDTLLTQLAPALSRGDIIVDGGNSYWGDSIKRAEQLKEKNIYFVDCGTSGGVDGARHGACFMAGGEAAAMAHVAPILQDLAVENGFVHTGDSGSGHYVKLVHNGIEFGMLQAIGEGLNLLAHYRDKLDFAEILKTWNNGSVIRSWLIDLMAQAYEEKEGFTTVPSFVEDTGEVNWLVTDALRLEVPIPVIAQSVMQLFASRDKEHIAEKAIAMMRNGFGGHSFGPNPSIQQERQTGKIENRESSYLYEKETV